MRVYLRRNRYYDVCHENWLTKKVEDNGSVKRREPRNALTRTIRSTQNSSVNRFAEQGRARVLPCRVYYYKWKSFGRAKCVVEHLLKQFWLFSCTMILLSKPMCFMPLYLVKTLMLSKRIEIHKRDQKTNVNIRICYVEKTGTIGKNVKVRRKYLIKLKVKTLIFIRSTQSIRFLTFPGT